ncbi:MAG: hypothetical protein AAFX81_10970 [Pseudomonadota bacterium]
MRIGLWSILALLIVLAAPLPGGGVAFATAGLFTGSDQLDKCPGCPDPLRSAGCGSTSCGPSALPNQDVAAARQSVGHRLSRPAAQRAGGVNERPDPPPPKRGARTAS